jgi:hypothetical protein
MPLTLTLTAGALPAGAEHTAFRRLCDAMLKHAGLTGNRFMTAAVIGSINLLPKDQTYSGLQPGEVAFVEWKVPPIAFADRAMQVNYVAEATQIIHELSRGRLPKEKIWVNVVHAVEGTWGIAGEAMTNAQLVAGIKAG